MTTHKNDYGQTPRVVSLRASARAKTRASGRLSVRVSVRASSRATSSVKCTAGRHQE